MKYPLIINDTEDELVVRFGVAEEGIIWHLIRAICDGDKQERIFGIELFLYEIQEIRIEPIAQQFQEYPDIEGLDDRLLYIYLRDPHDWHTHGWGYGRVGKLGVNQHGQISTIRIPWTEVGAATPFADRHRALAGLPVTPLA